MNRRRRYGTLAIVLWAFLAAGLASAVAADSTSSGRALVIAAGVVGVGAAIGAAVALARGQRRLAGVLLVVSVITPSSFAYVPNLLALGAGLGLWWPRRHNRLRAARATERRV